MEFFSLKTLVLLICRHVAHFTLFQKRDKLTRTKQARDHLRTDNHRLHQSCGLLGNESLLRDFETRKDEVSELKDKVEKLKMQHAELTLSNSGVRKKIDQVHTGNI